MSTQPYVDILYSPLARTIFLCKKIKMELIIVCAWKEN